jgi:hypothetical protein
MLFWKKRLSPKLNHAADILKTAGQTTVIFQNHNPAGPLDFEKTSI